MQGVGARQAPGRGVPMMSLPRHRPKRRGHQLRSQENVPKYPHDRGKCPRTHPCLTAGSAISREGGTISPILMTMYIIMSVRVRGFSGYHGLPGRCQVEGRCREGKAKRRAHCWGQGEAGGFTREGRARDEGKFE